MRTYYKKRVGREKTLVGRVNYMEDSVYKLQAFTMEPVVKPIHLEDAVENLEVQLREKD